MKEHGKNTPDLTNEEEIGSGVKDSASIKGNNVCQRHEENHVTCSDLKRSGVAQA